MHQFEAVYEDGLFRPLQPVQLAENQKVTVRIDEAVPLDSADQIQFALPDDRWRAFCDALDAPPREISSLRKLLTEPGVFDGRNIVT